MVIGNKTVKFLRYQNKEFWYVTECGFEFPVPIDDCGNAAFEKEDKAMIFMSWIRKHLESIELGKLG